MKAYLWLPLACLAGFIVGAWGARDELRAFKERARESKEKRDVRQNGFGAFARMVNIPETARHPRRARAAVRRNSPTAVTNAPAGKPAKAQVPAKARSAETKAPPAAHSATAPTNAPAKAEKRLSPEDLRARIEEAQDLWRTRVDLARAQWKSKLKLSEDSEKAFDSALQEMNERLYDSVAALAGILAEKEQMTPELGLRLVGETTTILAETYDRIGACAAPELRDAISTMQMGDFIDPGVAEPLIDVQGKLEGIMRNGGKGL